MVAASLAECLAARDTGRIQDIPTYEATYGVLVEKPIDDWDFPHEDIAPEEFEEIWQAARAELDQRQDRPEVTSATTTAQISGRERRGSSRGRADGLAARTRAAVRATLRRRNA